MTGNSIIFGVIKAGLWLRLGALVVLTPLLLTVPTQHPIPNSQEAVTIYDVQYTEDPSGDSPYLGQEVTISGIVTGVTNNGYFVAEAPGAWHAIYVYSMRDGPDIGDEVEVSGSVDEYYGLTEIIHVTDYLHLSSGNLVTPISIDASIAAQESYESALITVEDAVVTSLEDYGEWVIHDGTASIRVDDMNDYMYFPAVGDAIDSLTGNLFYSFGDYKIEPRDTADLSGAVIPHYALGGDVISMNAAWDIITDAYIEILGDRIVAIHADAPASIPIVQTGGLIYPGLIDAHNHPAYNVLDRIPFEGLFAERYEWQDEPLYDAFRDQFNDILDYGGPDAQRDNLIKFAEVRALTAGTTTIQGINANGHEYDGFARQGVGINNTERFPSRAYSVVFPLAQSAAYWEQKDAEYWERFLIHLSGGVNQAALDEFYAWVGMGMLDERTTIIHGIPYGAAEWSLMAAADASLAWSPQSNLELYGVTAHIPGALAAGVNVALAPDWTESGTLNLLSELKVANSLNQAYWGSAITPQQLAEFVTRNAAQALGIEDWAGQLEPGYRADLMAISGDLQGGGQDPYEVLLGAYPRDVILTVVSGRPMYGDPALMGQFPFLANLEDLIIGGVSKQLAIQIDAHAIPDSEVAFSDILAELEAAYQVSDPKVCGFLGIERELLERLYLPLVIQE